MYDAKKIDITDKTNDEIKYNCIADRSYFFKVQCDDLIKNKSSYIPIEDIIK